MAECTSSCKPNLRSIIRKSDCGLCVLLSVERLPWIFPMANENYRDTNTKPDFFCFINGQIFRLSCS